MSNGKKRTGLDLMADACAVLEIAPVDVLTAEVNGRTVAELRGELRDYLVAAAGAAPPKPNEKRPEARL